MTAARWVSIIAHAFVMAAVMVVAEAAHLGIAATPALLLVAAVAVLPLAVFMVRQVRRGS